MADGELALSAAATGDVCRNCKRQIKTMCFRGTRICSVNCEKELARKNAEWMGLFE